MNNDSKIVILMVGPPGSGKSTLAKTYSDKGYVYVNQDSQAKEHLNIFNRAILDNKSIIVDRMGFSKEQRSRYLDIAKKEGYKTHIIVLHEPYDICLERCLNRKDHETIKNEKDARSALNLFFSKYERVEDSEADFIDRRWPEREKLMALVCDIDGTLANVDHRLHFVRNTEGKRKNWKGFFDAIEHDSPNKWCEEILHKFRDYPIILCSGRPETYRETTEKWLSENLIEYDYLFMRNRSDNRQDNVTKEVLLDFEILTRHGIYFCIDDRQQVTDMYRKRGFVVLQCAKGNF